MTFSAIMKWFFLLILGIYKLHAGWAWVGVEVGSSDFLSCQGARWLDLLSQTIVVNMVIISLVKV